MTTPFDKPVDQEQRQRIESALEQTFFVEAGAGTGKTTSMVARIANLITTGKATIDSLAAITFTEAASAELRDRMRHKLEQIAGDEAREEDVRKRCLSAILGLDSASIQTLHSFAGSLLRERPLDAGLPPGFEITDEVGADIEFEERWQNWLDLALESDDVAPLLLEALNLGLKLDALREVAVSFHKNYDLLPQDFKNEPRPSKEAVNAVVGATDQIRSLLECNLTPDYLHDHASRVFRLGDRLAAMESDPDGALCLLDQFGKIACGKGNKSNWTEVPDTKSNACTVLKDLLKGLEEAKSLEVESVRRAVLVPLLESVRHMVVSYVDDRRKAGKAEFHDLLVWA
ncbi:MAG: UvrD-helicase domain-containing protein, partial [Dehalococcoidia bacterium]|nr:UvrD-helicase domain-containing protein [Dehalococcoidia bacterium]